uniref:ATP synthase-coupling factor 6, mitochondrial n=1 Tax=Lygus hesperus TaxID=30085 RepID=A0A146M9C8_LYGHE
MAATRLFMNVTPTLRVTAKRNFGVCAPALQKVSDPIQQLFLDKLREYKGKSSGGKLVDATPEIEREWKQELGKLAKHYGGSEGADMTKFPDFKFADAKLDPINLQD